MTASASDHWEDRLTMAPVERVSTSEACEGPIQRESRWSRRAQDGTVTPAAVQSAMISPGSGHFLGLLNSSRASSDTENVCRVCLPQSIGATVRERPGKKFLSRISRLSQNIGSCKGHIEVIQRFSCNYVLLCLGTRKWCHWFTDAESKCIITTNFTAVC